MTIEVVITIWEDYQFQSRNNLVASSFGEAQYKTVQLLDELEDEIKKKKEEILKQLENDDIPF